jgi:hypothetical protein
MAKKYNIEKFSTKLNYSKPELFPIDIDFRGFLDHNDSRTNLKTYKMILEKNYQGLDEFESYESNYNWQTGLMFAAYLGDFEAVKALIKEVGVIDEFDNSALDYARIGGNQDCIDLLSEFEIGIDY